MPTTAHHASSPDRNDTFTLRCPPRGEHAVTPCRRPPSTSHIQIRRLLALQALLAPTGSAAHPFGCRTPQIPSCSTHRASRAISPPASATVASISGGTPVAKNRQIQTQGPRPRQRAWRGFIHRDAQQRAGEGSCLSTSFPPGVKPTVERRFAGYMGKPKRVHWSRMTCSLSPSQV
jgi:hypothetical protein